MRNFKFCIALILLLVPAAAVMAQTPTLEISESDTRPTVIVDLNTSLTSFSKTITITYTGGAPGEAKTLKVQRFDLKEEGGKAVIDRSSISIPSASLIKDQPQDVSVTVSNVTRVGTYKAPVKFWVESNPPAEIMLTVVVKPKVDVTVVTAQNVQLVRCSPFPCSLIRWLPDRLLGRERGLTVNNQTPTNLRISLDSVLLRGDKTGQYITNVSLKLPDPNASDQPLGARKPTAVVLNLPETNHLVPDHYVGTINFGLNDSEVRPTVNYSIDVRDAPWFALLVLLIGVIVGRLVKSMNSPEAITQLKLIRRLYRLQSKTLSLKDNHYRARLLAELDETKERINAADDTEAVLTHELDKIETRINLLSKLEQLQVRIESLQNGTLKQELQAKCMAAGQALREGRLDECLESIKAIAAQLEALPIDANAESFGGLLISVRDLNEEGAKAVAADKAVAPPPPGFLPRALAWLSGANFMNAEVRYWLVRPVFFLLLLFLLVMVGLKTLYVDAGASFGSEGLYDYLGLFMWGISAEVAQNTLQNLRLPGASR